VIIRLDPNIHTLAICLLEDRRDVEQANGILDHIDTRIERHVVDVQQQDA
jgi:hypothetical protein